MRLSGPGGSRTRVQTGIPRSSTIIVSCSIFLQGKIFPVRKIIPSSMWELTPTKIR